jgi:hypothetical protein
LVSNQPRLQRSSANPFKEDFVDELGRAKGIAKSFRPSTRSPKKAPERKADVKVHTFLRKIAAPSELV